MGDITIRVSDELEAWATRETADHNARHGTDLTPDAWVALLLQERAVQADIPAEIETLQRQYDRDLQAAIRAKKQELMRRF